MAVESDHDTADAVHPGEGAFVDLAAQAVRYEGQGAVDDKQVLHPDGRQIRQAQRQPLDEHG